MNGRTGRVLFAAFTLGLVLAATLMPVAAPDTGRFEWCVACGADGLADFIRNVILFAPPAIALRRLGAPAIRIIFILLLLSAAIEVTQMAVPGRDSTLSDVVANALGAALGAVLAEWFPRRRPSLPAALAAGVLLLVALAATGLALQPSWPRSTWYGRWTPDLGQYEPYHGTVLDAAVGGLPVHIGRLDASAAVRERLARGEPITARFVAGPQPSSTAPIFEIADETTRSIVMLGASGRDLMFVAGTRALDLRLEQPWLWWRGALDPVRPGDTVQVTLTREGAGWCAALGEVRRCGLAYRVAEGWKLVQFWRALAPGPSAVLDVVWLMVLAAPLGLLLPWRRGGWIVLGAVLLGAAIVPPLVGLAFTPVAAPGSVALGVAAAAVFRRLAAGRTRAA